LFFIYIDRYFYIEIIIERETYSYMWIKDHILGCLYTTCSRILVFCSTLKVSCLLKHIFKSLATVGLMSVIFVTIFYLLPFFFFSIYIFYSFSVVLFFISVYLLYKGRSL
jgi:hypothetical protein